MSTYVFPRAPYLMIEAQGLAQNLKNSLDHKEIKKKIILAIKMYTCFQH